MVPKMFEPLKFDCNLISIKKRQAYVSMYVQHLKNSNKFNQTDILVPNWLSMCKLSASVKILAI